jgi:pumilio family protein 6
LCVAISKVAVGGKDNVLEGMTEQIHILHDAIASDAAWSKSEDIEHAFENFHSSHIIIRIVLGCPGFADVYMNLIFNPLYDCSL